MQVVDPSTGEAMERYAPHEEADIDSRLDDAASAFEGWRATSFDARAALLRGVAGLLRSRARALGELMAHEMGKPLAQGVSEAEKCAWVCEHYAEHGAAYLASEPVATDARESFVSHRPLGPVLAIMPWNFPFWQVFRQAAPGLMAGNVLLLKHAENVPGCALAIEALFAEAGAPRGAFGTLLIDREQAARVIRDPRVRAVALTGSTRAGRSVGGVAGEVLKKTVLELGGSDPYVVLEDADVALAARVCVQSRLINSGQSCIAAKRFIVVEPVRARFTELVIEHMRAATMGPPLEPDTEVGPQARGDLRDALHAQVRASVDAGAKVALGAEPPARKGFFYPPSVLLDVAPGMPAFDEELFGPVAAIVGARDEEDAIALANRSAYGLGAAVFTQDLARGRVIAEQRLNAGAAFVNAFVRSDPRLPFGGIGESGHGRELGRAGILELVNTKSVYIA